MFGTFSPVKQGSLWRADYLEICYKRDEFVEESSGRILVGVMWGSANNQLDKQINRFMNSEHITDKQSDKQIYEQ